MRSKKTVDTSCKVLRSCGKWAITEGEGCESRSYDCDKRRLRQATSDTLTNSSPLRALEIPGAAKRVKLSSSDASPITPDFNRGMKCNVCWVEPQEDWQAGSEASQSCTEPASKSSMPVLFSTPVTSAMIV